MKVLHVINNLDIGGAEKLLIEALPKFMEEGVEVELAILDGTTYPFLKQLQKKNCTLHLLGKGSVYNPWLIFKLISLIKKVDIVHVHLFPSLYWVSIAKMVSFSKTTLLFTEHSTSNKRRNNSVFKLLDRFIYKRYKKIVTISKDVDSLIKDHLGFNTSKFSLISNGVDLEKMKKIKPYDPLDFVSVASEKIIIQVSRFTKQKDQITLIKSIPFINNPVKLLLVGVGPLIGECNELVKELAIEDQVLFLGFRMDIPALLKTANVVVLSSKYEGLSLSGLEALASGRPLVASNVPGLEILVGGAGVLFPAGDEKQLAIEIDQLLKDSHYYDRVVNRGLLRAKEYSLDKMIQKHIQLYKDVCEGQN